jgi:hypothetical protein
MQSGAWDYRSIIVTQQTQTLQTLEQSRTFIRISRRQAFCKQALLVRLTGILSDICDTKIGSSYYLVRTQLALLATEAQNISQQDFKDIGINIVITIINAAIPTLILLRNKPAYESANKAAS